MLMHVVFVLTRSLLVFASVVAVRTREKPSQLTVVLGVSRLVFTRARIRFGASVRSSVRRSMFATAVAALGSVLCC